jgi:hypothetical protein
MTDSVPFVFDGDNSSSTKNRIARFHLARAITSLPEFFHKLRRETGRRVVQTSVGASILNVCNSRVFIVHPCNDRCPEDWRVRSGKQSTGLGLAATYLSYWSG